MYKFILIFVLVVQCVVGQTKTICANKNLIIKCAENQTLQIITATYGYLNIDKDTCDFTKLPRNKRSDDINNCTSDVTHIIQKNCMNAESCKLDTDIPVFNSLCENLNKTVLIVNYKCENLNITNATYPIITAIVSNGNIEIPPKPTDNYGCGLNTCKVFCAPGCQRTCFNTYIYKCKKPCIPYGCQCRDGYYRDPLNLENCIKYEYCPKMGNNTNEIYSPNRAGCQIGCGSDQRSVDNCVEICEQYGTCEAGYVCAEGYQRETCFLNIFRRQFNCVKTCPDYYWCS